MFLPFSFFSCCWDTSSELIAYRGSLAVDSGAIFYPSLSVYSSNLDFYLTPQDVAGMQPSHPDSIGNFGAGGVTMSHCINDKVEQWECGPLRILIKGDSITTYYDSLSNAQLQSLKQNAKGEWVLPTITLHKKH